MKQRYIPFLLLLLCLPLIGLAQTQITYQAESAQTYATNVSNYWAGYTGSGFVDYFTQPGSSALTFTVTVPAAGNYDLDTRYASAAPPNQVRTLSVWTNGARVTQAQFLGTNTWDAWATQTTRVALRAGTNTVRYFYDYSDNGGVNLDYLLVRTASAYEAAAAQLTSANAASSFAGYTGTGYAENITAAGASAVTFTVNAPTTGPYGLRLRYAAAVPPNQVRTLSVWVNGARVTQAQFPGTNAWTAWATQAVAVTLSAGSNTVSYRYDTGDNGVVNLDYLQLVPLASVVNNNWQSAPNDFCMSVDSLTQHLNRANVPTGILYDRVLPLAMLPSFRQGTQLDTASAAYFHQAYFELRNAAYNPTAFPLTPQALRSQARRFLRRDSVAVAVLDYTYNRLDTLAEYDGLLLGANRLFYDVATPSRSPYLTENITVAAALIDTIRATTTFYVPAGLLLTNRTRRVSSLSVDFGNGAGPVTCSPTQPRLVAYGQPGRKIIVYTVFFADGTQQQCRSSLYVLPTAALRGSQALELENVTAQESFGGYDGAVPLFGAGEFRVILHNALSQNEYNGNHNAYKLRKPLIVLDGFDPQDESGLKYIDAPKGFYQVIEKAGIFTAADQLERDVILLNFPNTTRRQLNGTMTADNVDGGSDYIERNALVLVALLNQLKSRLASTSEKFAIIGPSMGGLISRYALAYMEKRQYALTSTGQAPDPRWDHNTALWVSLDAPHQGANVPIGAQEFLRYFQYYEAAAQEKFDTRLNTPAARQMLLHHHSAGTNAVLGAPGFRDRFMQALRDNGRPGTLGYPELLRRVAITNGRLDGGSQGTAVGSGMPCGTALQMDQVRGVLKFTITRPLFFYRDARRGTVAIGDINFSPTNGGCDVFKGQIAPVVKLATWTWKGPIKRTSSTTSTTGSYDLAPGGWFDTQQQIVDAGSSGTTYKNVIPTHCFIPTVSALGFQYQTMSSYQSTGSLPNPYTSLVGRNLGCNNETPFDIYYGPAYNIQHVKGKDAGTSAFLYRELAGVAETPVFATAQGQICPNASATFAFPAYCGRVPITYAWTLSGNLQFANGLKTASGTSQVVYNTSNGTGTGQITVMASQQGLAPSAPLVYPVDLSAPEVTGSYSRTSGSQPISTVNQVGEGRIDITVTSPVADCNFSVSSPNFIITKTGPKTAYFYMGPYSNSQLQSVSVTITPTSGCFRAKGAVFMKPSAYSLAYAPNPASDELTVTAVESGGPASGSGSDTAPVFDATLYNDKGKKVKAKKSEKGKAKLDVRDLPNGLYNLRAGEGKETLSEHIVVSH
ncbi:MAG: CBM35 domain-containing protein [Janthinobacterium lividum]